MAWFELPRIARLVLSTEARRQLRQVEPISNGAGRFAVVHEFERGVELQFVPGAKKMACQRWLMGFGANRVGPCARGRKGSGRISHFVACSTLSMDQSPQARPWQRASAKAPASDGRRIE